MQVTKTAYGKQFPAWGVKGKIEAIVPLETDYRMQRATAPISSYDYQNGPIEEHARIRGQVDEKKWLKAQVQRIKEEREKRMKQKVKTKEATEFSKVFMRTASYFTNQAAREDFRDKWGMISKYYKAAPATTYKEQMSSMIRM